MTPQKKQTRQKKRKKFLGPDPRSLWDLGYRSGVDAGIAVVWKYFQNDWHGGEAIAELKKLKEESR